MDDPLSVAGPFRGDRLFLPVRTASMPFFAVMDFADDADLRLMIQNYLVPRVGWDMLKLFRLALPAPEPPPGEEGKPPVIFRVVFDEARLMKHLPVNMRDEFELPRISVPAAGFEAFNNEVMTGMARAAVSGGLLLSDKMRYLLEEEYLAPLKREAMNRLSAARESGAPFSLLRTLKHNVLIRVLGATSNSDLTKALIASPGELDFLGKFMTERRRSGLREDLEVLMRAFNEGTLHPEEIMRSVSTIEDVAARFDTSNK
jgi:hypothetical protein